MRVIGKCRIKNRSDFMNKKHTMKKTAALTLGMALAIGAAGCEFVVTDSNNDMAQTVATVNITESLKKTDEASAREVATLLEVMNDGKTYSEISKRDLIAYFLSTGYNYVQNYGYSYEDTFNMLLDGLVSRDVMIQYVLAHYLTSDNGMTAAGCKTYINEQLVALSNDNAEEKKLKELLTAHPEVLAYKYFLTDGGKGSTEDYDRAEYSLKVSLNASLDSLEESYITAEDEETATGETRTLPTGVGAETEDYYTTDYGVYTGRNTPDSCGEYERIKGSTAATRQKAYNNFLANLEGYSLIGTSAEGAENTGDITKLDYYYVELSSSLGQALINKYYEDLEDSVIAKLTDTYVSNKYKEIYDQQELAYKNDPTAFETAIGSLSDDSFVLYGLKDYGFVYNILIPFSASQNVKYTEAKNKGLTDDELFHFRKSLLENVKGYDQRDSWFSTAEDKHYAYEENGGYKFFEDNMNEVGEGKRYEKLPLYSGLLPYQGTVEKTDDGYECEPAEKTLEEILGQLKNNIEKATNKEMSIERNEDYDKPGTWIDDDESKGKYSYTDEDGEVNYNYFIKYEGKVDMGENAWTAADHFNPDSVSYKALSAVNEIMFAYSTDTGCLNTYLGYAVSPYGTDFVPEFEYAAQKVVKNGVGSYAVCATDYGWHIVYCSFVYGADGDVYGLYKMDDDGDDYDDWAEAKEGSFSNLFYESLKTTAVSNYTNEIQNNILTQYDNEDSVKRYTSRYKDLLELDK